MKLSIISLLVVLSATALGWSPFTHSSKSDVVLQYGKGHEASNQIESKFNPKELLKVRKPEFYNEALIRLERLEDQPLCHRVAAQLLMKNCRGLDGIDKQTYQLNSDHVQKHHIEAFTASLTVCEMEEVSFSVPEACSPFSSASIFYHAREIGHLNVSREQTVDCKTAIHQNPSNQHIWSNFVTSATVFCRAARSELENDQHILLHKQLMQNMAKFSEAVHEDLETIRQKMADNARAADSYLEKAMNNVNDWTTTLKQQFQSASKNFEEVDSAMNSITKSSKTAAHMVEHLVKNIFEGTAEVSAGQEKAMVVGTLQVQRRMDSISTKLLATEDGLATVAALINTLVPMVVSLSERVEASGTQSQAAFMAMANATDALLIHVDQLSQLKGQTSNLNEQLVQATENAQAWGAAIGSSAWFPDWTIGAGSPALFLVAGNFRQAASLTSNIHLGLTGLIIGQVVIFARHPFVSATCRYVSNFANILGSIQAPSAVTHKARMENLSIVATPVEIDSPTTGLNLPSKTSATGLPQQAHTG
ncbi:uncharacterized protein RSE6_06273 [Rhynchosporium secalis]|uniref:Nuclear membrane fusion protein Kar5 n=1 Tax=Rhynchosporium secalis TaxID=38038 RepID=A0A1E1M9X7_RHYSE|nr:uncharacterized protein RSE6_06273 [Rhynchosporium secalis]